MSKHFASLKVGDTLDCKGPMIKLAYTPNMKASIGMVAGGTGITPMLQVIEEVLRNPADKTALSLVFGNVTEEDILLKKRIDALAAKHPAQFKVLYVLDKPPKGWRGGSGFVTPAMLRETMPAPRDGHLLLVCGPPGMMAAVSGGKAKDYSQGEVGGALQQLGYTSAQVFKM
jgi:cytochrome-b5 reductase